MHKDMIRLLTVFAISTTATFADLAVKTDDVAAKYAQKVDIKSTEGWRQHLDFGFANTTGNTETLNLAASYDATYGTKGYADLPLRLAFDAGMYLTENDGTRDNEEYSANIALEQEFYKRWLAYATLRWLRNTFRNFDSKTFLGAGVGKTLFDDGNQHFEVKIGAAYNRESYSNAQPDHNFGSFTQYAEYRNAFNEIGEFYLQAGASENFDDFSDYEVTALTGVTIKMNDSLDLSIEAQVRYDHIPPVGFETTDTKTIVKLGYGF